jgi:flagellar biosynthesis protein FlhA
VQRVTLARAAHMGGVVDLRVDHGLERTQQPREPVRRPLELTEHVRERLGSVICQQITDGRTEMQVLTFDSGVEQTISGAIRTVDEKSALVLDPRVAEQVLRKLSEETDRMARTNVRPVLLCPPSLRRHVRRFTERLVPQLSVLSLNEVPGHVSLRGFGVVKV